MHGNDALWVKFTGSHLGAYQECIAVLAFCVVHAHSSGGLGRLHEITFGSVPSVHICLCISARRFMGKVYWVSFGSLPGMHCDSGLSCGVSTFVVLLRQSSRNYFWERPNHASPFVHFRMLIPKKCGRSPRPDSWVVFTRFHFGACQECSAITAFCVVYPHSLCAFSRVHEIAFGSVPPMYLRWCVFTC